MFSSRRRDEELDEELRAHLDLLADEHQRRGLSRAEAEQAALRDFGGIARVKESYREQRGLPWLETAAQDVRYAVRMWRRAPGFSLVVIAVVALGIGVNSAMFTLVNALLFHPLSGRASEFVGLYSHDPTQPNSYRIFSYPNYADIRDRNDVFDDLIAHDFATVGMPAGDVTRRISVELVSDNFFGAIGAGLAAGRSFTREEAQPGANIPVAIASYSTWQDTGFDPAFIGRRIRINTQDFTIVGVAPKGFTGTKALIARDLWLPLGVFDSVPQGAGANRRGALFDRANAALMVAGRLKPGISVQQANTRLAALSADLERAFPAENRRQILTVHPLSRVNITSAPSSDAGPAMLSAVLMPLSGAVLLIACLNVANMLLARSTTRRKEIAIRLALGGGRARLVRQLFTESLVLSLAGGVAGLLIGSWTTQLIYTSIVPILPSPILFDPRPDRNIVLATLAFALLSALAFGLAPALKISRPDLVDDLKDLGGSRISGRRFGARAWLVTCQIAMSLILMTAGGLFARGALRAAASDPGYRYDGLLLASIDPGLAGYSESQGRAVLRSALERLRRLPGVIAVSANSQVPFGDRHEARWVVRLGRARESGRAVTYTVATSDYFGTVALPIVRGRDFTTAEAWSAARVAIIDDRLAEALFPNEDPVGQQVIASGGGPPGRQVTAEPLEIVAVVPSIRDAVSDNAPSPHLYVPSGAEYHAMMHLHIRTSGADAGTMLSAVRRELRAVDDRLPVVELRTMQNFHDRGVVLWVIRTAGRALSGLGGLALLLAVVGVYGVKSYVVSQRTREIGIRLAIGASPRDIAWMLLRDGARMTLAGIALGFPLAIGLGRLLSAEIYDVRPYDPVVLAIAPLILVCAAGLATYVPARRGMRISPLEALRTE